MIKKDFIWLCTRFSGIALLIPGIQKILYFLVTASVTIAIIPDAKTDFSARIIAFSLSCGLLRPAFDILLMLYLLFYGKLIFNILHHTSAADIDTVLQKQNYAEILIRLIGIYWIWKSAVQSLGLIGGFFLHWLARHPQFWGNDQKEISAALSKAVDSLKNEMLWINALDLLVFVALAWYFLKHGKLIIKLFNRLWLGKENQTITSAETV